MFAGVRTEGQPRFEAVVLAASLGGPHALRQVLSTLPGDFDVPVLVVQHRCQHADSLSWMLQHSTNLPVRTAVDGAPLDRPEVVVVPAGRAAMIESDRSIRLSAPGTDTPASTTMSAVADTFGSASIGVVLTGKLDDGKHGVRAIKRAGGRVLVQDPATAHAAGMITAALATGCVDFVLPLEWVSYGLVTLAMAPGGADLLAAQPPHWAIVSA